MTAEQPTAASMLAALRAVAVPDRVAVLQGFFRTGPGEYAEGDRFIGVRVPEIRGLVRRFESVDLKEVAKLLASPIHEARLLAVLLLVRKYERAPDDAVRGRIFRFYLAQRDRVNNWDLVDVSAPGIVGAWLFNRSRAPLLTLARSKRLWERRIAIVSTLYLMRRGDLEDAFRISDILLDDPHDLIHKAVGWMLRVAGDADPRRLRTFLATRHTRMPRTMLRYAIEKFPERERRTYLVAPVTNAGAPGARLQRRSRASGPIRRR